MRELTNSGLQLEVHEQRATKLRKVFLARRVCGSRLLRRYVRFLSAAVECRAGCSSEFQAFLEGNKLTDLRGKEKPTIAANSRIGRQLLNMLIRTHMPNKT